MKGFLYGIGVGLVVSTATTAVFLFWRNKKKKECDVCSDRKRPKTQNAPSKDSSLIYTEAACEAPTFEDVKNSAIGSIYTRHEGAANIIRDSVETILENVEVSKDANNEMDQISVELDNMLRED